MHEFGLGGMDYFGCPGAFARLPWTFEEQTGLAHLGHHLCVVLAGINLTNAGAMEPGEHRHMV